MKKKGNGSVNNLVHFNATEGLTKKGLLFYESNEGIPHVDSTGKEHFVNKQTLDQIVENTNDFLENGGEVVVLLDHEKTFNSDIGHLEGGLYTKTITEDDIKHNSKLKDLIGKVGIFSDSIIIKSKEIVNKINDGVKPLVSVGLDLKNMLLKEVSLTPLPALKGTALYKGNMKNIVSFTNALTLEEALSETQTTKDQEDQIHDHLSTLLAVIDNIKSLGDEELQGQSRQDLLAQSFDYFVNMCYDILELDDLDVDPTMDQAPLPQGSRQPNRQPTGQYNENVVLAAFTLDEMENLGMETISEFFQTPWQRQKKPSLAKRALNTVGNVAKVGATVAGGAAALRYGRAGLAGRAAGAGARSGIANAVSRDLSKVANAATSRGTSMVKAARNADGSIKNNIQDTIGRKLKGIGRRTAGYSTRAGTYGNNMAQRRGLRRPAFG